MRVQVLMQAQGHVGIFGRIGAGLLKGDLIERELLGPFAGDVLETDRVVVQVLLRQTVHIVTRRGGVEHVGFEHGVEGDAAHGNALGRVATNGAVGEDIHVELGVLAHLEFGRIFQQRLQGQQHGVAVQLFRCTDVSVRQRNVGSLMGLHGEREPDQLRLLGVDPGGFGIEGKQLGVVELLQPQIERGLVKNGGVNRLYGHRYHRLHGYLRDRRDFIGRLQLDTLGVALDLVVPTLELQQCVQLKQLFAIRFDQVQVIQPDIQRHIDLDRRQLIGQECHLLMLFQLGRQGFGPTDRQGWHNIQLLIKLFEAAIDPNQQAGGGLGANARNAGNVVG